MLGLDRPFKVFLFGKPRDMRKGFGLVRQDMGLDPISGHLYVFINGGRTLVKVLYWDSDGLALFYKSLERGAFKRPTARLSVPNSVLLHY